MLLGQVDLSFLPGLAWSHSVFEAFCERHLPLLAAGPLCVSSASFLAASCSISQHSTDSCQATEFASSAFPTFVPCFQTMSSPPRSSRARLLGDVDVSAVARLRVRAADPPEAPIEGLQRASG